jgi:hypothetical protein
MDKCDVDENGVVYVGHKGEYDIEEISSQLENEVGIFAIQPPQTSFKFQGEFDPRYSGILTKYEDQLDTDPNRDSLIQYAGQNICCLRDSSLHEYFKREMPLDDLKDQLSDKQKSCLQCALDLIENVRGFNSELGGHWNANLSFLKYLGEKCSE